VDAPGVLKVNQNMDETEAGETAFDFEAFFRAHYEHAARAVARVTGDPARAEDLAAEALWKLWKTPAAHGHSAAGWLYRTAVRLGLNELRGRARRGRYEGGVETGRAVSTPEQVHAASEERGQVRAVLSDMKPRDAELLFLRASGLSYNEVAEALALNPASVGTLIARAQREFREEYVRRYGDQYEGR
jgi:RNA polymerase sigma-70 factor (ECF subfamily)